MSFATRWERYRHDERLRLNEQREREKKERVIAQAALAGWRFERTGILGMWKTWDSEGKWHGINATLYGAALYALHVMEIT